MHGRGPGLIDAKGLGALLTRAWDALKSVFTRGTDTRAEVIAELEASEAVHGGSIEAVGVATLDRSARPGKRWVLDGAPCEICIGNRDAGLIPLGATFPSGDQWPTAHPRCKCSCVAEDMPADYKPRSLSYALPRKDHPLDDPTHPGLTFAASDRARKDKERVVWIDVAKFDAAWSQDTSYYIGPGGTGTSAIGGRYDQARKFIEQSIQDGTPIDMGQAWVGEDGSVQFVDGRSRFAALRDLGITRVAVTVDASAATRMAEMYGTRPPRPGPRP